MINRIVTFYSFFIILIALIANACSKIAEEPSCYDWSFVVIGDVRQGYGVYSLHVKHIIQQDPIPEAAFCMGDIMLRPGNEVEWESFWHTGKRLTERMPLHIVRGNHEGNDPMFEEIFSEQTGIHNGQFYYTVQLRNTACIILDTEIKGEERSIGSQQFSWLTKELDSILKDAMIDHIFIFLHRPVYSYGNYLGSQLENADELHDLFLSNFKVKAIFAGHDHVYNRNIRDGLYYITTCGGGEPLYHGAGGDYYHFLLTSFYQNGKKINIKTIDMFNEVIEDYNL